MEKIRVLKQKIIFKKTKPSHKEAGVGNKIFEKYD